MGKEGCSALIKVVMSKEGNGVVLQRLQMEDMGKEPWADLREIGE